MQDATKDPGPPPPDQEFFPLEWNKIYGKGEASVPVPAVNVDEKQSRRQGGRLKNRSE